MKNLLKTVVLFATLAFAVFSNAQWQYVSCHPVCVPTHVGAGGSAQVYNITKGFKLVVNECSSGQSFDAYTEAEPDSSSYFDYKWGIPYQYPPVSCSVSGTAYAQIDGSGYGATQICYDGNYAGHAAIDGLWAAITLHYNSSPATWSVTNYNTTVNWTATGSVNYQDAQGYFHSYIHLTDAGLATVFASVDTTAPNSNASYENITAQLKVTVN